VSRKIHRLEEETNGVSDANIRQGARIAPRPNDDRYALILVAVAIVVFGTYRTMGPDIGSMVNKINTALTAS
jgi:hypothetical protein